MDERKNRIVDSRGKFVTVWVHQIFVTAMTCRYQFNQDELLRLQEMATEELEARVS